MSCLLPAKGGKLLPTWVVPKVSSPWTFATRRINSAEGSVELGNYPAARIELGNVRQFAEDAVNQMAELKALTVVSMPPFFEFIPIAGIILIAITVFVFSQSKLIKKELHRRNKIYTALLTTFNLKRPEKPKGDNIPVARFKKEKPKKKEPQKEKPKEPSKKDYKPPKEGTGSKFGKGI